jgi:hypothetical protein
MGKRDPSRHNATCASCGENYSDDNNHNKGISTLGEYNEYKKCAQCRKAQLKSGNERINKYTWKSLTEIDASWGQVKQGEMWEKALQKFAQSLPVDEELQQKLVEAMR